jgi:hypothetical protein
LLLDLFDVEVTIIRAIDMSELVERGNVVEVRQKGVRKKKLRLLSSKVRSFRIHNSERAKRHERSVR